MDELAIPPSQAAAPRWRPIAAIDRRLIGVLIEKAKTTPGRVSDVGQRAALRGQPEEQPLPADGSGDRRHRGVARRLRQLGAVTEVQGGGRVPRFRHHLYEWLGVDKIELAVMAELLLRSASDRGGAAGRAARMDPIPDLNALRPILASLAAKGLIVSLTPEGRGHVVTHALYEPRKWKSSGPSFATRPRLRPRPPARHAPAHQVARPPTRPPRPAARSRPHRRRSRSGEAQCTSRGRRLPCPTTGSAVKSPSCGSRSENCAASWIACAANSTICRPNCASDRSVRHSRVAIRGYGHSTSSTNKKTSPDLPRTRRRLQGLRFLARL